MIAKELLLEAGKAKGLTNKEHIEKDYFQDVFLFNLYRKTNKFIFKGGTAIYKLYGLQRFSEDLDFSLSEDVDLKYVENTIKDVVGGISFFELKDVKKTKDSLLVKIGCKGILTRYNSLRIDVNFKNKVIYGYDVKNYVPMYIDLNPFSLRMLKLEEIIAEKIHAIFMREKARDLFDLFFLLRLAKFDKKLVGEKLRLFSMKYDQDRLVAGINKIKNIWERELRPFVLAELPDFTTVRDFVINRIKSGL